MFRLRSWIRSAPHCSSRPQSAFQLLRLVGEARQHEIVQRDEAPRRLEAGHRAAHVLQAVPPGPVVALVVLRAAGVEAGPDAVQPRVAQPQQGLAQAGVGVQVQRAPRCCLAHAPRGLFQQGPLHQRLPLAALPEAGYRPRGQAQVRHGHPADLLDGGHEVDALLGGAHPALLLKADAAQAAGVAGGRGGQRRLPAAQEQVARRRAAVAQGAAPQVLQQAVGGLAGQALPGAAGDLAGVESLDVLPRVRVHAQAGGHEPVLAPAGGRVGEQRQQRRLTRAHVGGGGQLGMGRGQEGGHRADRPAVARVPVQHLESPGAGVVAHGQALGQQEQLAAGRQGEPFPGGHPPPASGRRADRLQLGAVQDLAAGIGVQ